jgi:glycosyltransferase involved in cell wall biosynthesis
MLEFSKRPKLTTAILLRMLALADTISLETAVGASEFPPYIQKKTRVIPGYRSRIKSSMQTKTEKDNVIRFVYVGGMVAVKGVPVLADAYAALGECASELHLYGTGDPAIVNRLESMNTVFYHGNVENEILRDSLPSYDAFVFPTEYENEGHPGVLIEAFMAGLPIIATDMPGINEMVRSGENGLIVPPGDAKLLAEAMRRIVIDGTLRANLAMGAEKAANLYDEQIVLPQLKEAMGWQ